MKTKGNELIIVISIICITTLLGIILFMFTAPIQVGGIAKCNSGNIDLDYNGFWINERVNENTLKFNSTYLSNNISIDKIENINCEFDFNVKANIVGMLLFN